MKKRIATVILGFCVCFTTANISTTVYGSEIVKAAEDTTEEATDYSEGENAVETINENEEQSVDMPNAEEVQQEDTAEINDKDTADTGSEESQKEENPETKPVEPATSETPETDKPAESNEEQKKDPAEQKTENEQEKTEEKSNYVVKTFSKTASMDKIKIADKVEYTPSSTFIDDQDKVKYSVGVPIDGIPSFITSEMVVGALKCQDETGYPASVTIAQIIQESGFGTYGPGGAEGKGLSYLAYQYNNLFGIKGVGTAGSVNMKTSEEGSNGESYSTHAGFRAYNTYTECINDRADLLKEVYGDLTYGVTDANTFAMKIGARWATDSNYGRSLIKQMETYDLYRLDDMTLTDFSKLVGVFANPCPGSTLTSAFGWRSFDNSFHKGIDLGTGADNIPVYAAEAGTVVTAGWSNSAGYWVVIDHGDGMVTKYMHHSQIFVEEGQHVEKGQQIGVSGTTGNSTGNHLHFQVEKDGVAVNPELYLGL